MTPYYAIWAWTKANLVSLVVFGVVFWAWGVPLCPWTCGTVHSDADKGGGHDRHSLRDFRLGWPLPMLFERGQRQIWLVWAYLPSFFGPGGPPMVTNVQYSPPGHQQGRGTWHRHSLGDFRLGWHLNIKKKSDTGNPKIQEIERSRKITENNVFA